MKKLSALTFLAIFVIFFTSCAVENEYLANLPKIEGFKLNKIYMLNTNFLAAYIDSTGNRLIFKLNESSATWNRILFKTKVSLKN